MRYVSAYPPVFLVILGTVIITQLNRQFSHVPNFIREVTQLWDRTSFGRLCQICDWNSRKFDLGSTFHLEVAFHICRIQCINHRNPYPYWIIFFRDWKYLQQTELNSAPSYPTSESTAVWWWWWNFIKVSKEAS